MNLFPMKLVKNMKIFLLPKIFVAVDCEVGFHSIAESILRFFGALPDSLIPSLYWDKCIQASKTTEATFKVKKQD